MTTDQKGTTAMRTSSLSPFAYHRTLPDGQVCTIKAASRFYTHFVAVEDDRGFHVYSDHASEALARKSAQKAERLGRGHGVSYAQVVVLPFDNQRPTCGVCGLPVYTTRFGQLHHDNQGSQDHEPVYVAGADVRTVAEDDPRVQDLKAPASYVPPAEMDRRRGLVAEAAKAVRATSETEQGPVADEDPDHLEDQAARLRERVDHIEQRYVEVRAEAMDAKAQVRELQDALERVTHDRDVLERALADESADHSRQAQALMTEVSDAEAVTAGLSRDAARQANLVDEYRGEYQAQRWAIEDLQRRLYETQAVAIDLGYSLLRTSDAPANLARQGIDAQLGKVGLRLTTQHGLPDEYADPAANPWTPGHLPPPEVMGDDEPVDDYDPGPEVDDEGGMSEYRHAGMDGTC